MGGPNRRAAVVEATGRNGGAREEKGQSCDVVTRRSEPILEIKKDQETPVGRKEKLLGRPHIPSSDSNGKREGRSENLGNQRKKQHQTVTIAGGGGGFSPQGTSGMRSEGW